jgi:hypothetical protein
MKDRPVGFRAVPVNRPRLSHQPNIYMFSSVLNFLFEFKFLSRLIQKPLKPLNSSEEGLDKNKMIFFPSNRYPKNSGTKNFMIRGQFGVSQKGLEDGWSSISADFLMK